MEFTYFPSRSASFGNHHRELGEGTHETGGARIVAQYLHHPAMTLGYCIEATARLLCTCATTSPSPKRSGTATPRPVTPSPSCTRGTAPRANHGRRRPGDSRRAVHSGGANIQKNWGHSNHEYAGGAGCRRGGASARSPPRSYPRRRVRRGDREARPRVRRAARLRCPGLLRLRGSLTGRRAAQCPATGRHASGIPHSGRDALCGSHILVVDDDPDIRTVNKALSQDGHIVIEASGGQEALALIDAQAPDLLVLDLLMPKQRLEVSRCFVPGQRRAALLVLVLTALDDEVNTSAGFDPSNRLPDQVLLDPAILRRACVSVSRAADEEFSDSTGFLWLVGCRSNNKPVGWFQLIPLYNSPRVVKFSLVRVPAGKACPGCRCSVLRRVCAKTPVRIYLRCHEETGQTIPGAAKLPGLERQIAPQERPGIAGRPLESRPSEKYRWPVYSSSRIRAVDEGFAMRISCIENRRPGTPAPAPGRGASLFLVFFVAGARAPLARGRRPPISRRQASSPGLQAGRLRDAHRLSWFHADPQTNLAGVPPMPSRMTVTGSATGKGGWEADQQRYESQSGMERFEVNTQGRPFAYGKQTSSSVFKFLTSSIILSSVASRGYRQSRFAAIPLISASDL